MDSNTTFSYEYSAKDNKEVQEIRKRYLPRTESKLDELRRLDRQVQAAGQLPALTLGIVGCLVFGLGLCMAMQVLGGGVVLGVLIGMIGMVGMLFAFPVYRSSFNKKKAEFSPRILELAAELSNEKNVAI